MTRVAVIGCGYWSRYHLAAWRALGDAELVAVCDTEIGKATAAARETGAKAYADVGAMLAEAKPDLVDIVTRMGTHLALVQQVARSGAAMIVQKPLAPTWGDATAILEVARDASLFLAV